MKKSEIIKSIQKSKNEPIDQNWLKQGRQTLTSYITDNPVRKPKLGRQQMYEGNFKKLILKPMPIAIIALIASLVTGGGVVAAAQDSLPTDVLYPVKLATETIQETVTFDGVKKVELQTRLAEKRLAEIQQLQEKDQATEEAVSETLKRYEKHLTTAQAYLSNVEQSYQAEKVASAAVDLESALVKQEAALSNIETQSLGQYQPTLTAARQVALKSYDLTSEVLEKIEVRPITLRQVPLNQKFEMKVKEKVSVRGENIQITLTETILCPPCLKNQVCLADCPASGAKFTINYNPTTDTFRRETKSIRLALNQQVEIGFDIYLKLLDVSERQATLILTKRDNAPSDKRVLLNQKFDLIPKQSAIVADYRKLKIKFQGLAEVMCVKDPCPGLIATFQATLPTQCYGQATEAAAAEIDPETPVSSAVRVCRSGSSINFRLGVGQSKDIFGAKVTLLDLNRNTATLIVNRQRIDCPTIEILCRPGQKTIQTGLDQNHCPVYKCSEDELTGKTIEGSAGKIEAVEAEKILSPQY